ncbi:MULE transposase domain [Sesbania bispinosa]|nr:MULE transposase domain [Sesbania bispinosa]
MEGSCWDNIYEEFRAEYAYENDMFDVTDNPMEEMTDYSDTFTTNEIFDNREVLLKWVRETTMTHGFVVVIVRSNVGGNGRKTTLVLGCERSGKHEDSDVVRDIVWTHPDALKLLNLFFIVLIIDTTYKTNKYMLPLLEVVGVTSTELTFSVAFAYMEQEKADNFTWVLEKLKTMIPFPDVSPQVIVTDRDIALMNAVEKVFPNATRG